MKKFRLPIIRKKLIPFICAAAMLAPSVPTVCADSAVAAFPGAEGAGKYATGGRGGKIVHVTNLNDSGTGSFRDAVSGSNRVVVFDVGGTITLKSDVVVKSNITILGQTAPGGAGITLSGYKLGQGGDNQIIRFISSRPGERGSGEYDAWGGSAGSNSIIDHCSIGWANDEQWGLYSNNTNQTVQYSIIGPSNCISTHAKGAHGFGVMFGKGQNSWHHNMIAHNISRNFRGKVVGTNTMDFVNNVIYDWGYQTGYGTLGRINYVGNYLKAGNSTRGGYHYFSKSSGSNYENYKFYVTGNKITDVSGNDKISGLGSNNWLGVSGFDSETYQSSAYFTVSDTNGNDASVAPNAQTADEAFETVTKYAGAGIDSTSRPRIDQEVMDEAKNGTGYLTGGRDFNGVTDSEQLAAIEKYNIQPADYESYYPKTANKTITDSDNDGMPDDWETARGLNPNNASDAAGDYLGQGYMNIEYYANDLTVNAFPAGVVTESPASVDLGPEYTNIKEELAALTLSASSVKYPSDLSLPQKGSAHNLDIVWSSSSSAIKIKNNQIYQVNRKTEDQTVTLTASISSGAYNMSKGFSVTVVSNSSFWKAKESDNAKPAGTELFDGLTTLFDATYKASEVTIDGEDFVGYISSSDSGKLVDGKATGTAFKYVAAESGYLTAYIRNLGSAESAKTLYIVEEGAKSNDDCIASAAGNASNLSLTAHIETGKTYYIYVAGSKGQFTGIEFSLTAKPVWWKASVNAAAGEKLMKNLSPSEAMTYKESSKEIDGEAFTGSIAGTTNPSAYGASGAALHYIPETNGIFTVYCKVGSGKTIKINDADGNVVNEYKNEAEESDFVSLSGELKTGVTYYAYVAGSKAEFFGASFVRTDSVDEPAATTSPTIAPTSAPQSTKSPTSSAAPSEEIKVSKVVKTGNTISYSVENAEGVTLDTFVAVYENGVLTGLKKVSQTVANGQVSFSCEGWNTTNARVFVWQEMNPVYKSCQLYNE